MSRPRLLPTRRRYITTTASPLERRLEELAREFDSAADYYGCFDGTHNELLRAEAIKSAAQLRFVRVLVEGGAMTEDEGLAWCKAAWRIICAIGRSNIQ